MIARGARYADDPNALRVEGRGHAPPRAAASTTEGSESWG